MRTEFRLFIGLAIFMLPLGIIYGLFGGEEAGLIMLIVTSVSFAFIGVYLLVQSRRIDGERPEDFDSDMAAGAGEVGSFPVGSIWPLVAATGVTVLCFGLTFTTLLLVPAAALIFAAVIGMARESEQSHLGHADLDAHAVKGAPQPESDFTDQVRK